MHFNLMYIRLAHRSGGMNKIPDMIQVCDQYILMVPEEAYKPI